MFDPMTFLLTTLGSTALGFLNKALQPGAPDQMQVLPKSSWGTAPPGPFDMQGVSQFKADQPMNTVAPQTTNPYASAVTSMLGSMLGGLTNSSNPSPDTVINPASAASQVPVSTISNLGMPTTPNIPTNTGSFGGYQDDAYSTFIDALTKALSGG